MKILRVYTLSFLAVTIILIAGAHGHPGLIKIEREEETSKPVQLDDLHSDVHEKIAGYLERDYQAAQSLRMVSSRYKNLIESVIPLSYLRHLVRAKCPPRQLDSIEKTIEGPRIWYIDITLSNLNHECLDAIDALYQRSGELNHKSSLHTMKLNPFTVRIKGHSDFDQLFRLRNVPLSLVIGDHSRISENMLQRVRESDLPIVSVTFLKSEQSVPRLLHALPTNHIKSLSFNLHQSFSYDETAREAIRVIQDAPLKDLHLSVYHRGSQTDSSMKNLLRIVKSKSSLETLQIWSTASTAIEIDVLKAIPVTITSLYIAMENSNDDTLGNWPKFLDLKQLIFSIKEPRASTFAWKEWLGKLPESLASVTVKDFNHDGVTPSGEIAHGHFAQLINSLLFPNLESVRFNIENVNDEFWHALTREIVISDVAAIYLPVIDSNANHAMQAFFEAAGKRNEMQSKQIFIRSLPAYRHVSEELVRRYPYLTIDES